MSAGAVQLCRQCDVECSLRELSCWCCGGVLEIVPIESNNGELALAWTTHAAHQSGEGGDFFK